MGLLVAVVVAVMLAGPAPAATLLEGIEVIGNPATAVRLQLSASVAPQARTLAAEGTSPDRVYLDLAETTIGPSTPKSVAGAGPLLLRIRAAQFDVETTRVVLDLARAVPFAVRQTERTITVELRIPGEAPSAAARPAPAPAPAAPVASPAPSPNPPPPNPVRAASESPPREPATAYGPPAPPPSVTAGPPNDAPSAPTPVAAAPSVAPPPATAPTPLCAMPPAIPMSLDPLLPAAPPATPAAGARVAMGPAAPKRRPPAPRGVKVPPYPLIVLDAGHGGRDPGAEGIGGVVEKDVVLEVTQLVASRLVARLPVDVLLTRTDDSFIPIERRVAGENATLFISLHANACTDSSARGLEIFYGGGPLRTATSPASDWRAALLGHCLDRALQARIGRVRGEARPGGFGVLVRNPVPSALVEIGYLTHPDEAARARDARYHALLADALVDGVAAFLRASAPPL